MFSINYLEVFQDCDALLRKNLTIGKFWFNDKFVEKQGRPKLNNLSLIRKMPDFWGEKINIQAIVGTNGSGKSTLLDLMYMTINNFSYMFERGNNRPGAEGLFYVRDLYVDLHFSIDISGNEHEACLMSRGNTISLQIKKLQYKKIFVIDEEYGPEIEKVPEQKGLSDDEIANLVKRFFYTIVSNYSMQSFIHKNYIRNVFLHNLSINREGTFQEDVEDENCWINPIFHKNDGYIRCIVLNPYRYGGYLDLDKELKLSEERMVSLFIWDCSRPQSKSIFKPYSFHSVEIRKKDYYNAFIEASEDFSRRAQSMGEGHPLPLLNPETLQSDYLTKIIDFLCQERDHEIYEKFIQSTKKDGYNISSSIFFPTKIEDDLFAKEIVEIFQLDPYREKKYFEQSLRYIRHKIIKIVYTYDAYKNFRSVLIKFLFKEDKQQFRENIFTLIKKIKDDSSHIVKKIRRVVNFIVYDDVVDISESFNEESFRRKFLNLSNSPFVYNLRKISPSLIDDFLPPPFFDFSLKLKRKINNGTVMSSVINYNMLSSGEIQLLQTLSVHAYHIANLLSVQNNRPKYNCINLVFDELEVCMHPEMQRQFVYRLLEMLKNIKNRFVYFNVTIVTHSPFILSDIPNGFVLYLKEGSPYKQTKTRNFGANINDLFRDSFFLGGGFVGEYAKEIISSLVNYLKSRKDDLEPWNKETSKIFIDKIVGDDIIEDCLREMYCQKFGKENE